MLFNKKNVEKKAKRVKICNRMGLSNTSWTRKKSENFFSLFFFLFSDNTIKYSDQNNLTAAS